MQRNKRKGIRAKGAKKYRKRRKEKFIFQKAEGHNDKFIHAEAAAFGAGPFCAMLPL